LGFQKLSCFFNGVTILYTIHFYHRFTYRSKCWV
jgi:predicted RND superfamily exporter protein